MAIDEMRNEALNLMTAHGKYTAAYFNALLPKVQERVTDLERKVNDRYFNGTAEWINVDESPIVAPDMERFEEPVYKAAREAIGSAGLKFSAGAWYLVAGLGTRFSPNVLAVSEQLTLEEVIDFGHLIGLTGFAFHSRGEMGPRNILNTVENLKARGMGISSVFANTFSDTANKYGGLTSPYAEVREMNWNKKLEGFIWCAQNDCAFQVDWLGQDGAYTYDEMVEKREMLIDYYVDMVLLTGVDVAIEFKPGDPAIFMDQSDIEGCLNICEKVESKIYQKIKDRVLKEMGTKTEYIDILEESARQFSAYAGKIGVNIEDAHVYTKTAQTVAHAVERAIKSQHISEFLHDVKTLKEYAKQTTEADEAISDFNGRLKHRHPNDAYTGNGDPDLIAGMVHGNDLILTAYHEQKHGLAPTFTYEPDMFAVREDPLVNFIESVNMINRAHAIAANLLKIERGEDTGKVEVDTQGEELAEKGILNFGQARLSYYLRKAKDMSQDYHEISHDVAVQFRDSIGKPIKFGPQPNPAYSGKAV